MKNKVLACSLWTAFIFLGQISVQAVEEKGIQFYEGDWKNALQQAETKDKLLFVDAFATWCGPCKYMDKNVFTNETVASYYNENFISYKMDVDKEKELAERYKVTSMPTYLFVSEDGTLVYRKTGAMDAEEFIKVGKNALEMPGLEKKFEAGERSPGFLARYLLANVDNSEDEAIQKIAEEYFKTQKEAALLSEENFEVMSHFTKEKTSREFQYYLKNTEKYNERYGEEAANIAFQVFDGLYSKAIQENKDENIAEIQRILLQLDPIVSGEEAQKIGANAYLSFYEKTGDWTKYSSHARMFFEKYGTDNFEQVMTVCFNYYSHIDDRKELEKAIGWVKKSLTQDENYANLYVYAALLSKMGEEEEA